MKQLYFSLNTAYRNQKTSPRSRITRSRWLIVAIVVLATALVAIKSAHAIGHCPMVNLSDADHDSCAQGLTHNMSLSQGNGVEKISLWSRGNEPVIWLMSLATGATMQQQLSPPSNSGGKATGLIPSIGSSRGDIVGTNNSNGQN